MKWISRTSRILPAAPTVIPDTLPCCWLCAPCLYTRSRPAKQQITELRSSFVLTNFCLHLTQCSLMKARLEFPLQNFPHGMNDSHAAHSETLYTLPGPFLEGPSQTLIQISSGNAVWMRGSRFKKQAAKPRKNATNGPYFSICRVLHQHRSGARNARIPP